MDVCADSIYSVFFSVKDVNIFGIETEDRNLHLLIDILFENKVLLTI